MEERELTELVSLITSQTGIIPRASHRSGIKTYIEKKLVELGISVQEYKSRLLTDEILLSELVNESTVNETYFFREEKQFVLLRTRIFPEWKALFGSARIKIWSAACSHGEEAYSLALLAKACYINAEITASDINSNALAQCKRGVFSLSSSVRKVDGIGFQDLLTPYRTGEKKIVFSNEIRSGITVRRINLSKIASNTVNAILPQKQNIIFLRNVFIYFDQNLRRDILATITEKCLSDGGILFVSMSEIAQLDSHIVPQALEKVMDGNVFYFRKKEADRVWKKTNRI